MPRGSAGCLPRIQSQVPVMKLNTAYMPSAMNGRIQACHRPPQRSGRPVMPKCTGISSGSVSQARRMISSGRTAANAAMISSGARKGRIHDNGFMPRFYARDTRGAGRGFPIEPTRSKARAQPRGHADGL